MTTDRKHIAALRGVSKMAIDATTGITDLVQALHARIARGPTRLGGPLVAGAVNGITDLVYSSVRGVTRAVGGGIDAALAQLGPVLEKLADDAGRGAVAARPARPREALLAALNGVLGDYLAATANPLAITMALRRDGMPLVLTRTGLQSAIEAPGGQLLVLVHGLCMNDLQWERRAAVAAAAGGVADRTAIAPHDHGAALARDLGFTPLYLHYNSGLHVSTNGRSFAALLEALVAAWPVPVERLVIVGHSMGGLVARSAVHYGSAAAQSWPRQLDALVFLGTPHHGAPLERGGHWIDVLLQSLPYTAPFARLGRVRSAGITDLRHGSALDEDWQGRDRFAHGHDTRVPLPLPSAVTCCAIAATTARAISGKPAVEAIGDAGEAVVEPLSEPLSEPMSERMSEPMDERAIERSGDGLVPVASALGHHHDPRFRLAFAPSNQAIVSGCGHLELLSSAAVYARLRQWLARRPTPA